MRSLLLAAVVLCPLLALAAAPSASLDIGPVGAAGSTTVANGVYTVRASGADIWGTRDELRFVYHALTGDGEITARVDSLTSTHSWTKAGVMIRETLNASSRFAYTLVSPGNGASFQYRVSSGASAKQSGRANAVARAPYWVRLRRTGNVFRAYVSADGRNWRRQGSDVTIAMGATVYAGLAVTSHRDGTLATARFSNVTSGGAGEAPANSPPTISGTPAGSATVGTAYAFTPAASDPDGNPLTFSIANRPGWATFNAGTGRLSGTPMSAGTYGNIAISVSDGQASAALVPFSIVVSTGANRAPVISGVPLTSVMQGTPYSFQPTATDADGDPLTFSIVNAPAWATFSTSTGRLQGTPAASHVGTYANIAIRVSDGRVTTSLASFSITVLAVASGSATLSWTPPTTNTDGSPLTNLAGYRVYWGTSPGGFTSSVTLNNAGLASYVIDSLAPATYYFAVTALSSTGVESALSNTASKTIR